MFKTILFPVLFTLFLVGCSNQYAIAYDVPELKTKLEEFLETTEAVIIRDTEKIGAIHADGLGELDSAMITIYSEKLINAYTRKKEYGINILLVRFESGYVIGEIELEKASAIIDYDEIDSLIKGIDYMSKVNQSAHYNTKTLGIRTSINNLLLPNLVIFRIENAKATCKLSALSEFKALLIKAKNKIDAVKYR